MKFSAFIDSEKRYVLYDELGNDNLYLIHFLNIQKDEHTHDALRI